MSKSEIEEIQNFPINKIWLDELPQQLTGVAIVVDAYCASANMPILLAKSPERLVVVNEDGLERARRLYPNPILIGESFVLPESEFACNNHFKNTYAVDVSGRSVLYMSLNGSRLAEEVIKRMKDGEVVAGSFQNAEAVARFAKDRKVPIHIIMAGNGGFRVEEDRICAEVIEKKIMKTPFDWEDAKEKISSFAIGYYGQFSTSEIEENLEYLVGRLDEFNIVPTFFLNQDGFVEVREATLKTNEGGSAGGRG